MGKVLTTVVVETVHIPSKSTTSPSLRKMFRYLRPNLKCSYPQIRRCLVDVPQIGIEFIVPDYHLFPDNCAYPVLRGTDEIIETLRSTIAERTA